jgi:hypothetical protein
MEKRRFYVILNIVLITGLILIPGCENQITREAGFLEGVISIGPICPVEAIPPDPGCLPTAETYKTYPISVWKTDGTNKIALLEPAIDGSYRTELAPGNYLVILERNQNYIGSSNLPVEVTIISQNKTILNIVIDTGIR